MINRVVIVGRLVRDPEIRYTQAGVATVNFTVACDRTYQSQNGERQADFIPCVAWRNQAEFLSRYIKKGYMVGVEGRIQTRTFQDSQNQTRYVTEVLVDSINNLQPRDNNSPQRDAQTGFNQGFSEGEPNYQKPSAEKKDDKFDVDVTDDDLPF